MEVVDDATPSEVKADSSQAPVTSQHVTEMETETTDAEVVAPGSTPAESTMSTTTAIPSDPPSDSQQQAPSNNEVLPDATTSSTAPLSAGAPPPPPAAPAQPALPPPPPRFVPVMSTISPFEPSSTSLPGQTRLFLSQLRYFSSLFAAKINGLEPTTEPCPSQVENGVKGFETSSVKDVESYNSSGLGRQFLQLRHAVLTSLYATSLSEATEELDWCNKDKFTKHLKSMGKKGKGANKVFRVGSVEMDEGEIEVTGLIDKCREKFKKPIEGIKGVVEVSEEEKKDLSAVWGSLVGVGGIVAMVEGRKRSKSKDLLVEDKGIESPSKQVGEGKVENGGSKKDAIQPWFGFSIAPAYMHAEALAQLRLYTSMLRLIPVHSPGVLASIAEKIVEYCLTRFPGRDDYAFPISAATRKVGDGLREAEAEVEVQKKKVAGKRGKKPTPKKDAAGEKAGGKPNSAGARKSALPSIAVPASGGGEQAKPQTPGSKKTTGAGADTEVTAMEIEAAVNSNAAGSVAVVLPDSNNASANNSVTTGSVSGEKVQGSEKVELTGSTIHTTKVASEASVKPATPVASNASTAAATSATPKPKAKVAPKTSPTAQPTVSVAQLKEAVDRMLTEKFVATDDSWSAMLDYPAKLKELDEVSMELVRARVGEHLLLKELVKRTGREKRTFAGVWSRAVIKAVGRIGVDGLQKECDRINQIETSDINVDLTDLLNKRKMKKKKKKKKEGEENEGDEETGADGEGGEEKEGEEGEEEEDDEEEEDNEEEVMQKLKVKLTSPYSVVRDENGNWEDPYRPPLGFIPGMGASDLLSKAKQNLDLAKGLMLHPVVSHNTPFGGQAIGSPRGANKKRKNSTLFNQLGMDSDKWGSTGKTAGRNLPNDFHTVAPLPSTKIPYYGRGKSNKRTKVLANEMEDEMGGVESAEFFTSSIQWGDIASQFTSVDAQDVGEVEFAGEKNIIKENSQLLAPTFRSIVGTKDDPDGPNAMDEDDGEEEDLSDEAVLRRHNEVLGRMKAKVDAIRQARLEKQKQGQQASRAASAAAHGRKL